jgi:hypothetical protein
MIIYTSGAYYELKARALGKNRQRETQNLERRYPQSTIKL